MKKKILMVDDDTDTCILLSRFLSNQGFEVDCAYNSLQAIEKVKDHFFDIVICDFRLGGKKNGKDVLVEIKSVNPKIIVLIITGYVDIKTAVEVIKHGAYDYLTKPLIPKELLNVIAKALGTTEDNTVEIERIEGNTSIDVCMPGKSALMQKLYKNISIVAPTNLSIILYGESGTGKEVTAKEIHKKSNRSNKAFIAMDCGTLSKELAGSELFGHVKGSFTGAFADKEGHFELANGGTLFLDEVANLSLDVQASLLRVIQERKVKRIGGTKEINVDVRIIVASNENLLDAYQRGKFREDLYHRFNEFSIRIPAVRERRDDIPDFAKFFLNKTKDELNKPGIEGFEDDIMDLFINYSWPGNLREFRNVIRRAVLLTNTSKVNANTLPWEITTYQNPILAQETVTAKKPAHDYTLVLKDATIKAQYDALIDVLKAVNFNKTKAASILKIDRKTLYNKIRIYNETMENKTLGRTSISEKH